MREFQKARLQVGVRTGEEFGMSEGTRAEAEESDDFIVIAQPST